MGCILQAWPAQGHTPVPTETHGVLRRTARAAEPRMIAKQRVEPPEGLVKIEFVGVVGKRGGKTLRDLPSPDPSRPSHYLAAFDAVENSFGKGIDRGIAGKKLLQHRSEQENPCALKKRRPSSGEFPSLGRK